MEDLAGFLCRIFVGAYFVAVGSAPILSSAAFAHSEVVASAVLGPVLHGSCSQRCSVRFAYFVVLL